MQPTNTTPALLDLLRRYRCEVVETPILQPASLFLDLSGESIRRRLFITQDADGRELCLRPEHTIPVCRRHIEDGRGAATYGYLGPVFRHRPGESGEFVQAGIESIGRTDEASADVEVLGFALDGLSVYPGRSFEITIGDMGLLRAVLTSLEMSDASQRRFLRRLASGRSLDEALAGEERASGSDYAGLLAAIEGQDPRAAKAFVEDVISIAGIAAVGGRSVAEIAERFLSRAASRWAGLSDKARDVLGRYLAIAGEPRAAAEAVRTLGRETSLALADALGLFEERAALVGARRRDGAPVRFAANLVRDLDYYTGFIFEVRNAGQPRARVAMAGGRYDHLLRQLGSPVSVPAVGCAFWLDRLEGSGR